MNITCPNCKLEHPFGTRHNDIAECVIALRAECKRIRELRSKELIESANRIEQARAKNVWQPVDQEC